MHEKQTVRQELPFSQSGLIYVLNGAVSIGDKTIEAGQAGWLDKPKETTETEVQFYSLTDDTRFVLYAAQPHNVPVVSHGPFIGDTMEDIVRLYKEYRNGEMPHLSTLPKDQKVEYHLQGT
jgi:redox-sensitive bicupin YhaK (pirin superfamily)